MEREVQVDFDFKRKIDHEIESKPKISENMKKTIKYGAFIVIGAVALGMGIGMGNNITQGYKIKQQAQGNVIEIQAKNEEIRKNQQKSLELESKKAYQKKVEEINNQLKIEKDKALTLQEKARYEIWVKNREDIIQNYHAQLNIYDKAYQNCVDGVKKGLMSLDDLTEVRTLYQDYKQDINAWTNFVEENTISYDVYHNLNEERKKLLKEELLNYQSGSLKRASNLEEIFIKKFNRKPNDKDEEKNKIRNSARNNMIDDLADMIKNDNVTTVTKKLKR